MTIKACKQSKSGRLSELEAPYSLRFTLQYSWPSFGCVTMKLVVLTRAVTKTIEMAGIIYTA